MSSGTDPGRSPTNSTAPSGELPVGDLVKQLADQTTTLVRQEIELARVEVTEKGKRLGIGAGMFGGAGLVALYALGALLAGGIMLLGTAVAPWLSAVIIGVALLGVAGVLALTGRKQVEQGTPPVPEQAIASTKTDVAVAKQRAQEGRS